MTAERVICDTCAYTYRHESITAGMPDLMCSKKPRGTLRKPTKAEEILLRDYGNLYVLLNQRGPLPEPKERKPSQEMLEGVVASD